MTQSKARRRKRLGKSSAWRFVPFGWAHPIAERDSNAAWEEKKHESVPSPRQHTIGSHAPVGACSRPFAKSWHAGAFRGEGREPSVSLRHEGSKT
mgnify:CR=1 FL=1